MSTSRTVNGHEYHVTTNRQERDLFPVRYDDYEGWVRDDTEPDENAYYSDGFEYRGNVYAVSEFEVAGDDVKALGFDGVQAQSAWDAIVVSYFTRDGYELSESIIVGHIHW